MTTEKKGIQNLTEAVDLVVGAFKVEQDAASDGSINLADAPKLLSLIPLIPPAIDQIGEVPSVLADLSSDEATALVAHISASHVTSSEKASYLIEGALKVLAGIVELVKGWQTPSAPTAPPVQG